jgi:hypothetical protein
VHQAGEIDLPAVPRHDRTQGLGIRERHARGAGEQEDQAGKAVQCGKSGSVPSGLSSGGCESL